MKTLRVDVSAEDIAAADEVKGRVDWWQWPVKRALESLIGQDVDIDGDGESCAATVGASDDSATLVLELDVNAVAWLDARYDREETGDPFFFELQLPDWLCALVDEAIDEDEPRCRVCGCTNDRACAGGCHWAEPDLCSACEP
jgi:hypothetical protein